MTDWRDAIANEAHHATEHPLVADVIAELLDNLGLAPGGLPEYGIQKVAHYAAMVSRAQTLGIDPDLMRLSNEEATSLQLELAAQAVADGVPVHLIEGDGR